MPLGLGRPRRDPDSTQAPAGQELQADTGADALATIRDAHTTALRVRAAAERSGRLTPEERAGLQR